MRLSGFLNGIENAQRNTVAIVGQTRITEHHLPATDIDLH